MFKVTQSDQILVYFLLDKPKRKVSNAIMVKQEKHSNTFGKSRAALFLLFKSFNIVQLSVFLLLETEVVSLLLSKP